MPAWRPLLSSLFSRHFHCFTSPSPKCPAYCAPLTPPNRFWWKEKHKMSSAVKTLIWSGTKWGLTGHSASLFEDLTKSINVHSWLTTGLWRWWAVCLRFCRALEEKSGSKIGGANEFTIKKSSSVASERRYQPASKLWKLSLYNQKRLIMIGVWLGLHLEGGARKSSVSLCEVHKRAHSSVLSDPAPPKPSPPNLTGPISSKPLYWLLTCLLHLGHDGYQGDTVIVLSK